MLFTDIFGFGIKLHINKNVRLVLISPYVHLTWHGKSDEFREGRRERRKPKDGAAHMMQCTCVVIKFVPVGLVSFCLLKERYMYVFTNKL